MLQSIASAILFPQIVEILGKGQPVPTGRQATIIATQEKCTLLLQYLGCLPHWNDRHHQKISFVGILSQLFGSKV